jgi:esterase/lipase
MEQNQGGESNQYYFSEVSTRLRDVEERSRIIKEKTHILGKNFVDLKQDTNEEIKELKKKISMIEESIEKIKSVSNFLVGENGKYVKKDELALVERMLKDFQPIEFVRMKDIDDIFIQKGIKQKNINSKNKK